MEHESAIDRRVRLLAEAQFGVVARRQLLQLGLGAQAIRYRRTHGRLVPLRRGVYALGHSALGREGRLMAAVLSRPAGTVLSHRSAAAVWGIRPWNGSYIELTVPGHGGVDRETGIVAHRSRLVAEWTASAGGLPVTSVAKTLLDLAAVVPAHHLRRAVERAEQHELFHLPDVERVLERHRGRPGSVALAALLRDFRAHGMTETRSDGEAAFLQLCLDHGLPRPQVNHRDGREVDFRWPAQRLMAEVDGWSTHRTRAAFTLDRMRDRVALRRGWRVARYTGLEVFRSPAVVAAELRELLDPDGGQESKRDA